MTTVSPGAFVAATLALQVAALAGALWFVLRRALPAGQPRLLAETLLIAAVTFLAFTGGALLAVLVAARVPAVPLLWLFALAGGSAAGYFTLAVMIERIFHLERPRARTLARDAGLLALFLWILGSALLRFVLPLNAPPA